MRVGPPIWSVARLMPRWPVESPKWVFCVIGYASGAIGLAMRVVGWRGYRVPARGRAGSICGPRVPAWRIALAEAQAPGWPESTPGGLAGDARGGQGIARGRVRVAELELITAGDALAQVMLTAGLLP